MIEKRLYLGPYLKCGIIFLDKKTLIAGCPKCQKQISDKFCGECGSQMGSFTQNAKTEAVNFHDLYQEMIDKFGDTFSYIPGSGFENYEFLVPNIKMDGIERDFWYRSESEGVQPISASMIDNEIDAFKKCFQNEIELFVKAYKPNTDIEWGLIHWYY